MLKVPLHCVGRQDCLRLEVLVKGVVHPGWGCQRMVEAAGKYYHHHNEYRYKIHKHTNTNTNVIKGKSAIHCYLLVFTCDHRFSLVFIKLTMKNQWKHSLVMMRECPCSTKTQEALENPFPPPSRFPLAMGFAPLDPRDLARASPSGNPSGLGVQNPWPREISRDWASGMDFPILPSSWWSMDTMLKSVVWKSSVQC